MRIARRRLHITWQSIMPNAQYYVCLITRNGAATIGATLDSIMRQTIPPALVIIVDDGSTDKTPSIIRTRKASEATALHMIRLADRGYDIRRVPENINRAYSYVDENNLSFQYSMISGDDCIYPSDYCEYLLSKLGSDSKLAVVSGDWGSHSSGMRKPPQGSGRFVRESFWNLVGRRYPVKYGWESWLIFKAQQLGFRVANYTKLRYTHLRQIGSSHKFSHWGIEMRSLGYHPLLVLSRFGRNIILHNEPITLVGNISMLANYLLPQLYRDDPYFQYFDKDLRMFVRNHQAHRIVSTWDSHLARSFLFATAKLLGQLYKIS